jgi:hypothetical protein
VKASTRIALAAWFLAATLTTSSFASTLLCQSGPKTVSGQGNGTIFTVWYCDIPANAVPLGKSLRVTIDLGTGGEVGDYITLNGTIVASLSSPTTGDATRHWEFILQDTGSTTGAIAGLEPLQGELAAVVPFGNQSVIATLPWSTGWTLEYQAQAAETVTLYGVSFIVEILD